MIVILAGAQTAYSRALLCNEGYARLLSRKRVLVLDRFVSDSEQDALFTAADIVWVGYRNHAYMSGVLVLAGLAGKAVVGPSSGEVGRLIEKHGIGRAVHVDQAAELAQALRAMLDDAARNIMGTEAKAAFASHSVENFGATVMGALDLD